MEQIMGQLPDIISNICVVVGAITLIATVIVKLTPGKKDDERVLEYASKFWKLISYLPTIGINPRTKKLEEAYKEMTESKDEAS